MKFSKKILPMVLAMAMVPVMSMPAFADGTNEETVQAGTHTITINNATGTYKAYQIFKGDLSEDKTKLSNIQWGNGVNPFAYNSKTDAKDIADSLNNGSDADAQAFAEEAHKNIKTNAESKSVEAKNGCAVLDGLEAGYYIIENSKVGTGESVSRYILQVTKDKAVNNKVAVPTFEKKLKDKNDTTGEITDWQDSADYDIGDVIPFKLEGVVASNYADYKGDYKFVFHDIEEQGLQFKPDSVNVYVDGNPINAGEGTYQLQTSPTDKCTFDITFPNLKNIKDENNNNLVQAGSKITVEYKSTLLETAVLGNQGNVNKAKLQFSNNPNNTQGGNNTPTGETPWDNVIVFTYMVEVNKVDQDNNALSGANFKLEKKVPGELKIPIKQNLNSRVLMMVIIN